MAATIMFEFANKHQGDKVLVVPANAVGEDADGRFVFVIKEAGKTATVEKQKVTLGALTANGFEVLSGITVGQKIVTAGLQTLLDGQQVKLN